MILYYHSSFRDYVRRWEEKFDLEKVDSLPNKTDDFFLYHDGKRLRLHKSGDLRGIYLKTDNVRRRVSKKNHLARACGVRSNGMPSILDATAGLGTDTMVLSGLGCAVEAFEKLPSLWAMLDDYIFANEPSSMRLHNLDSLHWLLDQNTPVCDVLYIDPMFPERSKKALPSKTLQYLRALSNDSSKAPSWAGFLKTGGIDRVLPLARERIVIKKRFNDPPFKEPAWQIRGKTIRYDIYRY